MRHPDEFGFVQELGRRGRISEDAQRRVIRALETSPHALDLVFTELGILREDEFARAAGEIGDIDVRSDLEAHDSDLVAQIGEDFLLRAGLLPLTADETAVRVVAANPFARTELRTLAFHLGRPLVVSAGERSRIISALRAGTVDEPDAVDTEVAPDDLDLDVLKASASDAPMIRLVSRIFSRAVSDGASDIHVEPQAEGIRIRERIDGRLVTVETVQKASHGGLIARLKVLARLNIAERRLPQDGRIRTTVKGQPVDIRVSSVPSSYGESLVLRILDRSQVRLDLDRLGFDGSATAKLKTLVDTPNGIVLLTGPTGSGKTTTLYALLRERLSEDVKIFTVEDPVEYRIDGITQLQVNPEIGLDFPAALRSVLRQDPDVILVGEIRDRDTAEIAVRAALTGHLVLSTLHTNGAAGTITRLRDLGIDDFLISATLRGVVSQRLVRRSCQDCAAAGCERCGHQGHRGRLAVYEILPVSASIAEAVAKHESEAGILARARSEGFRTLVEDAGDKIERGQTSSAEVFRVLEPESLR
ncbi:GspE/PulE family protein [Aquibium sp. ELW1220]|uniref:GspE/PulE family protein n=1 Tax=Aquibium sp. ELW1220 TaxID=2976766 RepID=UPI0025B27360|nr:GspE/PulE family protein [Aquibium sp. ELW1220]MDN2581683.1 GspE/PulE family protein [Aquibium sp. ELW1220]